MAKASKLVVVSKAGHVMLVYKNGLWALLSGRRLAGESDLQCVQREKKEEVTGLRTRGLKFWRTLTKKKMDDAIFIARGWGFVEPKSLPGKKPEIDGVGWFLDWRSLPLTPTTRYALELASANGYLKR